MSDSAVSFQCHIENSDPSKALDFEILFDNKRIFYSNHVGDPVDFEYKFDDTEEAEHALEFVMTSKTQEFTIVDDVGNITSDAMLSITKISIDEINISKNITEKSIYLHNFNGSGKDITDQFFGDMGCNGRVIFKFKSPFYLWLLENT